MKAFFNRFINNGTSGITDVFIVREVRLVNFFSYVILISLIFGLTNTFFVYNKFPELAALLLFVTSIFSLVFNYYKKNSLAAYFLLVPVNVNLFFLNQHYSENVGNYMYYFLVIYFIAVLNNPNKKPTRTIVFFLITFASFLGSKLIKIPSLRFSEITLEEEKVLLFYNQFLCFSIGIIIVFQAVRLINRQNIETLKLLDKEKEAQKTINQSLVEKEVLFAEIQHRVKNNLAIIASLIRLQADKATDKQSIELFEDTKNRVISMSMVHDKLYNTKDLSHIDLSLYLSDLVSELVKSFSSLGSEIKVEKNLSSVLIELTRAVPVGLIVNEALTNSLKHAFNETIKNPTLTIGLKKENKSIFLTISDNGVGFNYPVEKKTVLGLSLINSLAQQIDAKTNFQTQNGTVIQLEIPE
ncbi:MAG: sensor histidine kinase [Fluviicola sp.]